MCMSKVLIVEDDESWGRMIALALRSGGHDSVLASDGEMALELMRTNEVDLVITDLAMPVLNGLRLIRAIRASGDTIPIIAVSGKNADQLVLAEDYGANAAISKPFDGDELLALVERIVDDNRSDWASAWIHPAFGSVEDR